ncbi:MAG TPA: HAMP domain-containing sensor histidine kinase [Polyangiaceae bacterium]|nr:HAMP domain-containing sensor histidine kinase [Polyangiaceae bacterium]
MAEATQPKTRDFRLILYVIVGALLGGCYVLFDVLSESRIRQGNLTGLMEGAHTLVDRLSPVLVGVMLGLSAHYLRLRAQLSRAESAAARVRARLQKVERDQAVWVLAAAILHELNNPLHAIGLLLDELTEPDVEADAVHRRGILARIRGQTDKARRHLQTLRTMRATGEPEVEGVTLDRVIGSVAEEVRSVASVDGLMVQAQCEKPVQARADATYVRIILENLVDNSLASLREGGGERVTIRLTEEDGRAVIRVHDDGPPIDAEVDALLFEPLRTTKVNGLGLGLPIARALARAMRGELSLERGAGKTFRLELPVREVPG